MNEYRITMSDGGKEVAVTLGEGELRPMMAETIVSGAIASSMIEGEDTDGLPFDQMVSDCAEKIPASMLTTK